MDNAIERYKARRDARLKKRLDEFKEGDHPRDENGKFTSGGGGGGQSKAKKVEEIAKVLSENKPRGGANKTWKENIDKMMDLFDGASKEEQDSYNKILKKYGLK